MGQPEQGRQNGTGRMGQADWDRQIGTGRMGQAEWDRQNGTGRTTGLPGQNYQNQLREQDCQHKAAKIRQLGQDETKRTAEKTAMTGQLE
jgi:hypothetical protein